MEETTGTKESFDAVQGKIDKSLEEMMEAGLHFGHKSSKAHPKMKPYIAGVRNTIHILNLEKTKEKLEETLAVLGEMAQAKKVILLVGTKVQIRTLVREAAEEAGVPYVTGRWIGGLFTNFEEVSKRIAYLKDLESKRSSEEEWGKYTKWERHEMEEEIKKLEKKFGGVKMLEKLPDAMFVFDLDENDLAVREAKQKGIPVFAISDTNCDPTRVDYAIPANDDAVSSVRYIVEKVKETLLKARLVDSRQADVQ
jgi:small subunit ribosomal protein S2